MPLDDHEVIERLISSYVPLYNKDFPLILFWTPKSGCTTFNKWFFFQIGLLDKVNAMKEGKPHSYRSYIYREEPKYSQQITLNLLESKKDTYKLVRNPYKRAVSSFLHTLSHTWLKSVFHSYVNDGLSFKQYLHHLKQLGSSVYKLDRHIAPQYIEGEERFINNYIQLEEFTKRIREIEMKYNLLNAPLSELSKSSHHFSDRMTVKGDYAEKALTKDSFNGMFPTYDSFYNKETIELVKEIFKKDFEMYRYKKSYHL
ncbi:hypothetical protein JOC86_003483 [Bacillus pakistanensis]|uniref:Sulfotransferase family protein n=1 Tax=Rossellomorea pakistanensis TaxID=992288 RepID=A0ABS2NH97_9BACI|nr:sulfotransferase family 2 domain-containing protein [Bacillus pakistanensis]MBM7586931.1 hypothetical protein [Bacillus pakistanensis]